MSRRRDITLSLDGITVLDAQSGNTVGLGTLQGVHVLVLLRHRH